ncbi:MAG TPA: hypothetical protein VFK91_04500, partial [Methyloceanibacter sp.]|nr:hypothetical protein [Methyloceanibacter sp.]
RTPAGGIAIVTAAAKENLAPLLGRLNAETGAYELSDEDYRAHVVERSIPPEATDVTELPKDWQPPQDRTFRNAWTLGAGGAVDVDMPRAREVWRARMRKARAPLLAALDVDMSRAFRDSARQNEIEAKRQTLRDVTADPAIEAATTPEELDEVWPQALSEKL